MAAKDKELDAISSIIDLLKPLNSVARGRILEYVLKRLDMDTLGATAAPEQMSKTQGTTSASGVTDIRALTAEKQPRSANEMVALVAYYLSELAPEEEASRTINVDKVRKYFKTARFPLPRAPQSALPNAVAAGYLENVSRGEYRLNPVGYNLVVHGLPRSSSPAPKNAAHKSIRRGR